MLHCTFSFLIITRNGGRRTEKVEKWEKHWVSSLIHSAVGAASRAQENHVTLFPGGAGHASCHKHSIRERKVLSLQALALETRHLFREWNQAMLK